ncbi:hypothetical protein [Streptomyces sp. DH37]|uniref:hypothetical protein n=1 Tax=Streptomyces sp. DH37 TaxID=3040122 RepID=UPI0024433284|nr:hypothetical protein [Streptomyces sp. DH37]MDG9703805.1 hypothetical protein [Streptomyces sp. DH37]
MAQPKVPDSHVKEAERQLAEFFKTQGAVVAAKWPDDGKAHAGRSSKALSDVFDLARWNRVLAPTIFGIALAVATAAGRSILAGLGLSADDYDAERTHEWLTEHAAGVAAGINGATRFALADALDSGASAGDVREMFGLFIEYRAPRAARTEVTAATGFGVREAGQQSGQELTKTWITGSNPRKSHAAINGETVGLKDTFSNGARWPGDSRLDDKERSNCNCSMRVDKAT